MGHSSREVAALLALLSGHGVGVVCDVRAFPRSRRWPQFNRESLEDALAAGGVAYHWCGKELGGYRESRRAASPHTALDGAWRAYADHMESEPFRRGVARLLELARDADVAFLCAEKDWRHCHRRLIADHLVAIEEVEVRHLLDDSPPRPHRLDPRARIVGATLVYDLGRQTTLF